VVEALEMVGSLGLLAALGLILVQDSVGSSRASAGSGVAASYFGSESIEFALLLYMKLWALKVLRAWRMQGKGYDD
jgi:hypothetical protein